MKNIIKDLFNAQAHFGHQRRLRTPQLKSYIYKTVNKIDIIDLNMTKDQLIKVNQFLDQNKNLKVLIVSSRMVKIESTLGIEQIHKWKPGYISNFKYGKLSEMPDVIIIDRVADNPSLVNEAQKAGITTIGLCDTNTNNAILEKINYKIVMNDDSNKAVELLISVMLTTLSKELS